MQRQPDDDDDDFHVSKPRPRSSKHTQLIQLNYQQYQQSFSLLSPSKHYYAASVPLTEKIWQSACRVFLKSTSRPEDEDKAYRRDFPWEDVIGIDMMVTERPKCPICLEDFLSVPRVTYCGHVFCWCCILRYIHHETFGKGRLRCPICSEALEEEELRPARIQRVHAMQPGKKGQFVLALKRKRAVCIRCPAAESQANHLLQRVQYATPEVTKQFYGAQFYGLYSVILGLQESLGEEPTADSKQLLRIAENAMDVLKLELEKANVDVVEMNRRFDEDLDKVRSRAPDASLSYWLAEVGRTFRSSVNLEPWRQRLADILKETGLSAARSQVDFSEVEEMIDASDDFSAIEGKSPIDLIQTRPSCQEVKEAFKQLDDQILYQAWDGQLAFLSPSCIRMIFHSSGCSLEHIPVALPALNLLIPIDMTVSPESRSRLPFLQYLPDGLPVTIWEVDVTPLLKHAIIEEYRDELAAVRQRYYKERQRKDRVRQRYEELQRKRSEELAGKRDILLSARPVEQIHQSTNVKSKEDFPSLGPSGEVETPKNEKRSEASNAWRSRNDFPDLASSRHRTTTNYTRKG